MPATLKRVLSIILLAAGSSAVACESADSTDSSVSGAPPSSLGATAADAPEATPQAVPSDIEELGLAARYAMARDRSAAPCQRFLLHAAHARADLSAVQATAREASTVVASHLPKLASTFGRFDGELLGELTIYALARRIGIRCGRRLVIPREALERWLRGQSAGGAS